jgi:hypothetical protein
MFSLALGVVFKLRRRSRPIEDAARDLGISAQTLGLIEDGAASVMFDRWPAIHATYGSLDHLMSDAIELLRQGERVAGKPADQIPPVALRALLLYVAFRDDRVYAVTDGSTATIYDCVDPWRIRSATRSRAGLTGDPELMASFDELLESARRISRSEAIALGIR